MSSSSPISTLTPTRANHAINPVTNDAHRWRESRRLAQDSPPRDLSDWLFNQDSLTKRLVAASAGEFQVQVLAQGFARPRPSEQRALNLPERQVALIRTVLLLGCGQPWVFARSIIPLTTLRGPYRFLRHLGSQPLGELLFSDPTMRRGDFELLRCKADELDDTASALPVPGPDEILWGRRSVFYLNHKPLLVGEIFLPGFTPLLLSSQAVTRS